MPRLPFLRLIRVIAWTPPAEQRSTVCLSLFLSRPTRFHTRDPEPMKLHETPCKTIPLLLAAVPLPRGPGRADGDKLLRVSRKHSSLTGGVRSRNTCVCLKMTSGAPVKQTHLPVPHSLHILRKQKSPRTSSAAPNWIRSACTYMSCVGNWDPKHPRWNNRNRNTHSRAL